MRRSKSNVASNLSVSECPRWLWGALIILFMLTGAGCPTKLGLPPSHDDGVQEESTAEPGNPDDPGQGQVLPLGTLLEKKKPVDADQQPDMGKPPEPAFRYINPRMADGVNKERLGGY